MWINFFEVYFVSLKRKFVFGRKIIAPRTANNAYAIAVASASGLLMIIEARKTSVNVPRSAPRINGIAFFRLINLATASGTNSPIVMLDEKTSPVITAPMRYALYFDSKYLFMNLLAFLSPPKTSIIDFPRYFNVIINIVKARTNIMKLLIFKIFTIGEVIISMKFGIFKRDILSPSRLER